MSNKHQMVENNYKQATRIIEAATLGQSGLDVNNPEIIRIENTTRHLFRAEYGVYFTHGFTTNCSG